MNFQTSAVAWRWNKTDKIQNILTLIKSSKKNTALAVIAVVFVVLFVIVEFIPESKSENTSRKDYYLSSSEYINNTEKKLEKILGNIDGAGRVNVMITLKNCYENVYATSNSSKQKTNGSQVEYENDEEYITLKNGSSSEECLVIKVYEPEIKGVAVVAEGAGNASVKKSLTETVCSVFGISSTKVSVEKMNKTK